jgi:hypothetical protein
MEAVTSGKGDAISDGTGGSIATDIEAITSGKGNPIGGSGNSTGDDAPTTAVALPRQTGVGTAFDFPADPLAAAMWATGSFALVLGATGLFIRRGEHARRRQPGSLPRWVRLGL